MTAWSTFFFDPIILAKAFRGELVPQDPNDTPVEEMLERMQKTGKSK
jgi:type I restriction enzyme S subunit